MFKPDGHRLGDTGVNAFDEPILWLSNNCYQELPRGITTARDYAGERPLLRKCVLRVGTPEPRGDLFAHIKPPQPLPEPKPGLRTELPERLPEIATAD